MVDYTDGSAERALREETRAEQERIKDAIYERAMESENTASMATLGAMFDRILDRQDVDRIESRWGAYLYGGGETYANADIAALIATIRELRKVLADAEATFRAYGNIHAAKPDPVKAMRNYDMADKMRAALGGF